MSVLFGGVFTQQIKFHGLSFDADTKNDFISVFVGYTNMFIKLSLTLGMLQ